MKEDRILAKMPKKFSKVLVNMYGFRQFSIALWLILFYSGQNGVFNHWTWLEMQNFRYFLQKDSMVSRIENFAGWWLSELFGSVCRSDEIARHGIAWKQANFEKNFPAKWGWSNKNGACLPNLERQLLEKWGLIQVPWNIWLRPTQI